MTYMQDFFSYFTPTGSITEGPTPKRRKTTGGVPPPLPAPTQTAAAWDVDAEPPEGPPESQTADLYRPSFAPLQQSLYANDCFNVDIEDPKYNTFTHVLQCPPGKRCYCGLAFNSQEVYLPVSLGKTTRPMAMIINVLCGCTCKKAPFKISFGVPQVPAAPHQKQA